MVNMVMNDIRKIQGKKFIGLGYYATRQRAELASDEYVKQGKYIRIIKEKHPVNGKYYRLYVSISNKLIRRSNVLRMHMNYKEFGKNISKSPYAIGIEYIPRGYKKRHPRLA